MGIKGAWETFEHAAIVEPLTELCLRNGGFSDLSNNSPEYVLGVDANNVLSRALSPVLGERGLARRHWAREARSSDLIGAITSLAGYFNSPCTVVFVFDGPLKSDMKRDKAIVPRDPRVIKNYKRLLNVLGFNIWEALGEADADLGIMSKFGLANSVLSDDSDLFVLGARTVLRTRRNDCGLDDRVACYRAVNIRRHGTCGLDATQLVLLAILVGNEYEPMGLPGCTQQYAIALARSNLAPQLCDILKAPEAMEFWRRVDQFRARLRNELLHNTSGLLPEPLPHIVAEMPDSFPNMDIVRLLTRPTTSQLSKLQAASRNWRVRMPDLRGLTVLCAELFQWNSEVTLDKLRANLFPGICTRFLLRV
ncbi:PIN domain-like protein [Schizophyllum amplum]|uniref:PIN domain-like protein n=1 Tax=Schizophyllum amplum TaxID=97359 RepID=A0A550BS87_9AGAR|nr:PIN domain-like protein [Auriculariopsis ampla]